MLECKGLILVHRDVDPTAKQRTMFDCTQPPIYWGLVSLDSDTNPQYIGGWYHLTVIPMVPQKMGAAVDEVRLYEEGILTPGFAHTVLCNEDGTLVVPEGIRAIRGAFHGRQDIKSVVLPDGIIEVGDSAFNCC